MAQRNPIPLRQRIALYAESVLMASLVPKESVGSFYAAMFRIPLLLRRIGLAFLIPSNVLILTTRGRRSGILHRTPVEYSPGPAKDIYLVMSGWEGRTDWYRNARANPRVSVWLAGKEWDAVAEPAPDVDVARLLQEITRMEPAAARMWSRWGGVSIDGTGAGYLAAAPHFPSLYLRPVSRDQPDASAEPI